MNKITSTFVLQTRTRNEQHVIELLENLRVADETDRLYLPKKKMLKKYGGLWHEEITLLFPGYIFLETYDIESFRIRLMQVISGVKSKAYVIGINNGQILSVYDEELEWIQRLTTTVASTATAASTATVASTATASIGAGEADGVVGMGSRGTPDKTSTGDKGTRTRNEAGGDVVEISRGFKENDRVRFVSGPLVGMESYVRKVNRHKRLVMLSIPFLGEEREIWVSAEILNGA